MLFLPLTDENTDLKLLQKLANAKGRQKLHRLYTSQNCQRYSKVSVSVLRIVGFFVSVSVSEHLVKETSFGISFGKKGFALEKFSIRKKSRSKFLCRHTVDTEVRLHPFGFNQLGC